LKTGGPIRHIPPDWRPIPIRGIPPMDPHAPFCPNPDCPARGQGGRGNLRGHCRKTRRSRGTTWDRTCAAPRGTPSSRRETPPETVPIVLTWLDHGCPRPAIVATFGRDERTVARGQTRAGPHCQWVPEHLVQHGRVDRHHVPADERDVTRGARVWRALARAVPSRLGLGGVIRPRRDLALILALGRMVRSWARRLAIRVCGDGRASDITAFVRVFRDPVLPGRPGRPRLQEVGVLKGPVITHPGRRRGLRVTRRGVRGPAADSGRCGGRPARGRGSLPPPSRGSTRRSAAPRPR
jgi:hypothetical protein